MGYWIDLHTEPFLRLALNIEKLGFKSPQQKGTYFWFLILLTRSTSKGRPKNILQFCLYILEQFIDMENPFKSCYEPHGEVSRNLTFPGLWQGHSTACQHGSRYLHGVVDLFLSKGCALDMQHKYSLQLILLVVMQCYYMRLFIYIFNNKFGNIHYINFKDFITTSLTPQTDASTQIQ